MEVTYPSAQRSLPDTFHNRDQKPGFSVDKISFHISGRLESNDPSAQTAKNLVSGPDLPVLQAQARQLAEAQAADCFSEAQLAHAERLAEERKKVERYYCQQEMAVAQIAIENIRQAKQRELLERRRTDLVGMEQGLVLVPDLSLIGMALVV